MNVPISKILDFLKNENYEVLYNGSDSAFINKFCPLSSLKKESLTWIKKLEMFDIEAIDENLNLIIIADKLYNGNKNFNIISTNTPKAAYFSLLDKFFSKKAAPFVAPNSTVLTDKLGEGISIGYNCFIDKDVEIGDRTVICNNVVIENAVKIGNDCTIESGSIIGTAGYGYYDDAKNQIKKVPDFGGIIIGNRVDIGANTCIARGTLNDTIIGDDVKIDNLVHIGHNSIIENECMIVAMSMTGGSVKLKKRAYIAPCSAIMNQMVIGENSFVGMGAVVTKDVDSNKVVTGVPARVFFEK